MNMDWEDKVICPITDPYVVHHGSLGSFVTVFCSNQVELTSIIPFIDSLPGVEGVFDRETAGKEFELPPDRDRRYHCNRGCGYRHRVLENES